MFVCVIYVMYVCTCSYTSHISRWKILHDNALQRSGERGCKVRRGGASWIEKGEVGISEPVLRFRYPCSVCISRWWIFLVWFLRWRDGGDGVDPIHGFVVGFWGVDVKIWVYVCHYMYMCMYMYAGSMGGAFRGWLETGVTD